MRSAAAAALAGPPKKLTTFIGRRPEMLRLQKALETSRLVTLVGPGGVGKTRIAAELAAGIRNRWADGVFWVDLAPVSDGGQIVGTIALSLGLHGPGDPEQQIASWLRAKKALVILDNCEHLIDACAAFCERALATDGDWGVLATSRQVLGVTGEQRFPVTPLDESEAFALFVDRARLVLPAFQATPPNSETITRICRRIDHLPLAIELVASRAGMMTETDLLRSLDDRLQPVFAARSQDPRHVTLEATIDWSFRLLTDAERILFCRLAVFRGGFGIEAVKEVCGVGLGSDVLPALSGLVDKSMVIGDRTHDGETRYWMLDSQGAYAEARLHESGEMETVRRRHYEYFKRALLQRTNMTWAPLSHETAITTADNRWKRRETENFWSALQWARNNVDDLGLPMGLALQQGTSGSVDRKRQWVNDILAKAPDLGSWTSWVMGSAAGLAWDAGDMETSLAICEMRLERVVGAGDWLQEALTLTMIGNAEQDLGHVAEARAAHEKGLALVRAHDRPELTATVLNNLGCWALIEGDSTYALKLLAEAADLAKQVCGPMMRANFIESLASAQLAAGQVNAAEQSWREAVTLAVDSDNPDETFTFMNGLARAAAARADYKRAVRLGAATQRLSREYSFVEQPFWAKALESCMQLCRMKLAAAYEDVWRKGQDLKLDDAVAYALGGEAPPERPGPLTRREIDVLRLVVAGQSNREVASKLFLSERTVEGHLDRIRTKLGVHKRAELGVWAAAHGFGRTRIEEGILADSSYTKAKAT